MIFREFWSTYFTTKFIYILLSLSLVSCSSKRLKVIKVKSIARIKYGKIATNFTDCLIMNKESCEVFNLVNQYRKKHGLNPLLAIENCIKAANYHAHQMQNNDELSHYGRVETWSERVKRFDAVGQHMSENIARAETSSKAFDLWTQSEEHNTNMLNPVLTHTGVGYSNYYWTQCFLEI